MGFNGDNDFNMISKSLNWFSLFYILNFLQHAEQNWVSLFQFRKSSHGVIPLLLFVIYCFEHPELFAPFCANALFLDQTMRQNTLCINIKWKKTHKFKIYSRLGHQSLVWSIKKCGTMHTWQNGDPRDMVETFFLHSWYKFQSQNRWWCTFVEPVYFLAYTTRNFGPFWPI